MCQLLQKAALLLLLVWLPSSCSAPAALKAAGQTEQEEHRSELLRPRIDPIAAKAARAYAKQLKKKIHDRWAADLLLATTLKIRGKLTDARLEELFRKCVTPDSTIRVGILGGSISVDAAGKYPSRLQQSIKKLCPASVVEVLVYNGSRSWTGSLTLGACAYSALGLNSAGPDAALDLFISEFTLNDGMRYKLTDGTTSSLPYELMLRTVLTSFGTEPPAMISLHFWGPFFTHKTIQADVVEMSKKYGLTAVSMRDAVWPYVKQKRAPFQTVKDVTADMNHPTLLAHELTADNLELYIAQQFLAWVDGAIDGTTTNPKPVPKTLPKPMHDELKKYKLEKSPLQCAIVPANDLPNTGRLPDIFDAVDVSTVEEGFACVTFMSASASAKMKINTQQGRLMISNCNFKAVFFNKGEKSAAFRVYLLENGGGRKLLKLRQILDNVAEMYEVTPPLASGKHTIEITKNPTCDGPACKGFLAVATF